MKIKLLYLMLLAGILISCEKDLEIPSTLKNQHGSVQPTTDGIIKVNGNDLVVLSNSWNDIAYGNGKYVAVDAAGYVATSIDGKTWTTPMLVDACGINCIAYADGKFVVGGNSGYTNVSHNGVDWARPKGTADMSAKFNWVSITYGNGKFVAVGSSGHISTSIDGEIWTTPNWFDSGHNLIDITYGDGKFVAVGASGIIGISFDGISWAQCMRLQDTDIANDIVYGKKKDAGSGKFVAVGYTFYYDYIITSLDGEKWTSSIKTIMSEGIRYLNVVYSNNTFIAVGYKVFSPCSYISTSVDGTTWTDPVLIKDESGNPIPTNVNGIIAMP